MDITMDGLNKISSIGIVVIFLFFWAHFSFYLIWVTCVLQEMLNNETTIYFNGEFQSFLKFSINF
jgi:hypothetical protein